MKTEKVFSIGGEGGSITILRQFNEEGVTFLYHHSEFDPTDEGLDVSVRDVYTTFEEPFQLINKGYRWYELYIMTIHDDYKPYIIECLLRKLNERGVSLEDLDHCKYSLEKMLGIELKWSDNKENGPCWTC
jgi:hypothetical protein